MIHLAGLVAVVLGVLLRAWAIIHLYRGGVRTVLQLATTQHPPEGWPYTTSGPYRFLRHPMYVGSFLTLGGLGLAVTGWWGAAALVGIGIWPHYNQRIVLENQQRRVTEAVRNVAAPSSMPPPSS